jgi:hypothetical protein
MSHATVLVAVPPDGDMEEHVSAAMRPFDENGEWFSDGSRWDWFTIGGRWNNYMFPGNIIQVKNIAPNQFIERKRQRAEETWAEMQKEDDKRLLKLIYGFDEKATKEDVLNDALRSWFPTHYAFLHEKKWHERSRMGWFGCDAKTECEIRGDNPKVARCKAASKNAPEAYIVSWGDDSASWDLKFYNRFIQPLPPETVLVTVDYHV